MCNKKILLLDDELETLNNISSFLNKNNWQTDAISCANTALDKLANDNYFLLITDLVMPDLSGSEVIEKALMQNSKIKVIIITSFGYDPTHSLVKLYKNNHFPIVLKPFEDDPNKLLSLIETNWNQYLKETLENN